MEEMVALCVTWGFHSGPLCWVFHRASVVNITDVSEKLATSLRDEVEVAARSSEM
jgi:hypothetical protein